MVSVELFEDFDVLNFLNCKYIGLDHIDDTSGNLGSLIWLLLFYQSPHKRSHA